MKPRILRDEGDMKLLYSMMAETCKTLLNYQTRNCAVFQLVQCLPPIAINDMHYAKKKGEKAYQDFAKERVSEDRSKALEKL